MNPIRVWMPRCTCPACCKRAMKEGLENFGSVEVVLALTALEAAIRRHGRN